MKAVSSTLPIALILIMTCALSSVGRAQSQPSATYALTHAKIFTLAGSAVEDGTLIIHDGKIAAVGVGLDIPAGAQVIDATGLQVYPGFFDSITQMGLREIGAVSATVDSNETGSYNPDVVAATAVLHDITSDVTLPHSATYDVIAGRVTLAVRQRGIRGASPP